MSAGLSETKNAFARKIQKLTTRSRSSSNSPQVGAPVSSPPSPTDYFSQPDPEPTTSRSRSGSGYSAPLTPVTPTGLPGVVGLSEVNILSSPERIETENTCPYCQLSLSQTDVNPCKCNKSEEPESRDESEIIADKMAQKILHQVVSQSEQGWTI